MGRRHPRRYRRQSERSPDRCARPACPRPGRVLSGAFRCHRVPAQSGGWPHMFRAADGPLSNRSLDKIDTSRYYDVVNFARRVKVPGLYSWGFNDETCPPTSMYSAYNVIPGQKKLLLALETGHNNIPEQVAEVEAWLQVFLKTASSGN